jgi:1-phosphofructokinase family hexose kinase
VIVCVATNASVDKLFEVDRLVLGEIHRPRSFVQVPGGKGLNVARAAATLGAEVTAVTLLGGEAGRWVQSALTAEGIRGRYAWASSGDTRSSLSVADRHTGRLTEFYEDGSPISAADWEALLDVAREAMVGASWLTISGSLPPGAPGDGDASLIRAGLEAGIRVALDTRGAALAAGVAAGPDLVKVNASEAAGVLGTAASGPAEALDAAATLAARTGGAAAVTLGADGAALVAGGTRWLGRLTTSGWYPVGSGDSFLAGMVVALEAGGTWPDGLRLALGSAAANAAEPGAGRLRRDLAEEWAAMASLSEVK